MAVAVLERPRSRARAAFAALRPRQWSKNLLLFAGLIFAAKLGDVTRWLEALLAFGVYCAASSAAYLVNDVRDAEHDREHPVKRLRPVASGELPPATALVLAAVLAAAAFGGAAVLGLGSVGFLAGFLVLQAAYTAGLKHVVLIDVLAIAGLFVVRASAGAEGVDVRISPWLLDLHGPAGALPRAGEAARRARSGRCGTGARPAGASRAIRSPLVDQLVTMVAASTVIAYSLYTFTARDSKAMMATVPFVRLRRLPVPAAAPPRTSSARSRRTCCSRTLRSSSRSPRGRRRRRRSSL